MRQIAIIDSSNKFFRKLQNSFGDYEVKTFSDPYIFLDYFKVTSHVDAVLIDFKILQNNECPFQQKLQKIKPLVPPSFVIADTNSLEQRIFSLKKGYKDYFDENMHNEEILLRIKSHITNIKSKKEQNIECDGVKLSSSLECTLHDKRILLTKKEFLVLKFILLSTNYTIDRDELINIIWPTRQISHKTLNTHICNLNIKLIKWNKIIKVTKNSNVVVQDK
ncbi:MAG: winged helix-turn-helix domain-containing protein [Bacteriovoracaceae bacterium]|jgi:DNA-binding response OmpR family regulator|nr:winged helix-turn-helix domain-containing protein [Bacteriovoracaceae bacterium]